MAAAPLILMVASAAIGAASQISAGREAKRAAEENADITRANSARQAAADREQALLVRRRSRQALGSMRAAMGESGLGFGDSAEDILAQSAANAELDFLNVQAGMYGNYQAGMFAAKQYDRQARSAMPSAYMKAGGTILGAAGSYYGSKT